MRRCKLKLAMAMAVGRRYSWLALRRRPCVAQPTAMNMAAIVLTTVTALVAALPFLPGSHGYGVADFLTAYTDPGVSRIEVTGDVILTSGLPELSRSLTIVGIGTKRPVIDGRGKYSGISMSEFNLTVKNVEFRNLLNSGSSGGGAIYTSGATLVIESCVFRGNKARSTSGEDNGYGGAVCAHESDFTISRCQFISNRAGANGGAFQSLGESSGSITDCQFSRNLAGNRGGAVALRPGGVDVRGCTFDGNKAAGDEGAGALSCSEASCVVSNNVFKNNAATSKSGLGGAVRFYAEDEGIPALCKGNSFSGNIANGNRSSDNLYIWLVDGGPAEICDAQPPPLTLIELEGASSVKYNECGRC
ncbi:hypothetical protein CBR_g37973 [Chara braunii]|uniref:Right handed beta helix domain-containing protein n=1 Tax=Chara braunii TaxID=69332 RepID=A0A388LP48_CHABU|nr:hypothetical protein CBR_g37973 [Chara braunii]|eukprot:GBG84098.1 hypothetical protein CBR_g37973 [Chara braunii]